MSIVDNKPTPWSLRASVAKWAKGWLTPRKPHFVIANGQLLRWYILPRNPYFNLYLHKFQRDDEDRALHDHPWWFVSLVVKGRYEEVVPFPEHGEGHYHRLHRGPLSLAFRPAIHRHRVVLPEGKPCWTIVATGSITRAWGFWCPKGFVVWYDFLKANELYGETGRGCGEQS